MSARRALLLGLSITGVYLLLRTLMLRWLPATNLDSYLLQDSIITVLRGLSALAFYLLIRARWKNSASGLHGWTMPGTWAWAAVVVLLAGGYLSSFARDFNSFPPAYARALELAIALVVAANEELEFRGLFYNGLREVLGRKWAVWGSSLLFMAHHLGYQPLFHLPQVLFIGLGLAFLRDKGLGLGPLIVIHLIMDSYDALRFPTPPYHFELYAAATAMTALAAILATQGDEKKSFADLPLLFVYGTLKRGQKGSRRLNMDGRADWISTAVVENMALLDLGEYPGLIASRKEVVLGELWALRDPDLLKELDEYEGSDYLRDRVSVKSGHGNPEAWTYVLAKENSRRNFRKISYFG